MSSVESVRVRGTPAGTYLHRQADWRNRPSNERLFRATPTVEENCRQRQVSNRNVPTTHPGEMACASWAGRAFAAARRCQDHRWKSAAVRLMTAAWRPAIQRCRFACTRGNFATRVHARWGAGIGHRIGPGSDCRAFGRGVDERWVEAQTRGPCVQVPEKL